MRVFRDVRPWWLSFADPHKETGQQFLGVAIVQATDFLSAIFQTHALGINPGGEVRGYPIPATDIKPGTPIHKLMQKPELEKWFGELTTIDELKEEAAARETEGLVQGALERPEDK